MVSLLPSGNPSTSTRFCEHQYFSLDMPSSLESCRVPASLYLNDGVAEGFRASTMHFGRKKEVVVVGNIRCGAQRLTIPTATAKVCPKQPRSCWCADTTPVGRFVQVPSPRSWGGSACFLTFGLAIISSLVRTLLLTQYICWPGGKMRLYMEHAWYLLRSPVSLLNHLVLRCTVWWGQPNLLPELPRRLIHEGCPLTLWNALTLRSLPGGAGHGLRSPALAEYQETTPLL